MISFRNAHRFWFAGDGGSIDLRLSFHNESVQGNPVAGTDEEDIAHFGFFRRNGLRFISCMR